MNSMVVGRMKDTASRNGMLTGSADEKKKKENRHGRGKARIESYLQDKVL